MTSTIRAAQPCADLALRARVAAWDQRRHTRWPDLSLYHRRCVECLRPIFGSGSGDEEMWVHLDLGMLDDDEGGLYDPADDGWRGPSGHIPAPDLDLGWATTWGPADWDEADQVAEREALTRACPACDDAGMRPEPGTGGQSVCLHPGVAARQS